MLVVVGRIGRPHGIRGEVTVEVRTDEPEHRLAPGAELVTEPAPAGPLTVRAARWHGDRLLVAFEGVADRAAAESLRGVLLQVDVDPAAVPEDPDAYYDRQLVGLAAYTVAGAHIGEVSEVVHLPAQDLLAIRREGQPEVLVPFVAELVPEVDLAARRLVVAPPPGLLELAESE